MEIYKIRNKEGLYWEGGNYDFSQKGKQWKLLKHVKSAITNVSRKIYDKHYPSNKSKIIKRELPDYLKDCEIVKFELIEKEIIKIEENDNNNK